MSCGQRAALEYSAPEGVMDRFDPRWDDDRDPIRAADREWGGRSGRDADPRGGSERGPFTRHLDVPRGDERERVRGRGAAGVPSRRNTLSLPTTTRCRNAAG